VTERQPSISDKLAYYALLLFEKPIGLLPTSWMWHLGAGIGKLIHSLAKKRKAIVQANLKIVHPNINNEELEILSKEVFRKSFGNLISSINTGFIPFKKIPNIVTIQNQEKLKELKDDKGCIFLLFHMGNWELLSRASHLFHVDKPSGAMYRPLNNALINDYITQNREKDGTLLFGRKKGLVQASKFIRKGGMLGILADQHSGQAGIDLPLFGKETSITPLPSMLAQKYQCPIMPLTIKTVSPGKWEIAFSDPIEIPKDLNKKEATARLIPVMEQVMKNHCSDIFWLHDRWKIKHSL